MKIDAVSLALGGALGYAAYRLGWLTPLFTRLCQAQIPSWAQPLQRALCLAKDGKDGKNGSPPKPITDGGSLPDPTKVFPAECPALDPRLLKVQFASNPAEAARQLGIKYQDGMVFVTVNVESKEVLDRLRTTWGFILDAGPFIPGVMGWKSFPAEGRLAVGVLCGAAQTPGVVSIMPSHFRDAGS